MSNTEILELLKNDAKSKVTLKKWLQNKAPKIMLDLCDKLELTYREFADRYGISQAYISLLKSKKEQMGKPLAIKILSDYIKLNKGK